WAFVSVAKMAQATWKLRKTAMVDIVVFEKYLEEHCLVTEDEDVNYERKKNRWVRLQNLSTNYKRKQDR
ncbi:MAG: hypothetical protein IJA27_01645, partial [Lachnospiraceae bacterium]|nr:hypothetical protein [Lachnospiraceae bacterium]